MADLGSIVEDIAHFTCIWKIENISVFDLLYSPLFTMQAMSKQQWYLMMKCNKESGFIELGITRTFSEDEGSIRTIMIGSRYKNMFLDKTESINILFEFSFLGIKGLPFFKKHFTKQFNGYDIFALSDFVKTDEVFIEKRAEILPRDTLTVSCRMWKIASDISRYELCFARSCLKEFQGSSLSEIKDVSSILSGHQKEVHFNLYAEETIKLLFHPRTFGEPDEQTLDFTSITSLRGKEMCKCRANFSILDVKGKIVYSKESDNLVFFNGSLSDFPEIRKMIKENKESLIPNDVLSLKCEYDIITSECSRIESYICLKEATTSEMVKTNHVKQDETCVVSSSFKEANKNLLNEGTFSDVFLQSKGRLFPAHKCILSARSPVFRAMFNGDMKGKTSESVEIPDVGEDTLRVLLAYIYTDRIEELEWRSAVELYKAAEKYELPGLKKKCVTFLKIDLSVSNVCDILMVADTYQDPELREAVHKFIMQQREVFFSSDEWRSFKEKLSKQAVERMERIFCNVESRN